MKYKIKKYTAIAAWHWNIPDTDNRTCRICHQDFDNTCAKCRIPGDECPIIFGKCKHYFHLHCIHTWNDAQNRPTCPLCRAPWEIDAYAGKNSAELKNNNSNQQPNDQSNIQSNPRGIYIEQETPFPDEGTPSQNSSTSSW